MSVTSPARTPPWTAAPTATTSSGFTDWFGSRPNSSFTFFWTSGIRVEPPTRSTSWTSDAAIFTFTDREAPEGAARYWLGARSCSGPEGLVGPIEVSRLATTGAPLTLALAVSPNPATSAVRFALRLPEAGAVELAIYDLGGRRVATPLRGAAFAGETNLEWNLASEEGARVRPGMYFAKLNALGRTTVTRITVLP